MSEKTELKLDHVALLVKDIQRSVKWYQERVNAEVEYQDDTWAMLKIGDAKIALMTEGQHPSHVAFRVPNPKDLPCQDDVSEHRDGSQFFYAGDPDGNTIEWIYYPSAPKTEIANDPIDW